MNTTHRNDGQRALDRHIENGSLPGLVALRAQGNEIKVYMAGNQSLRDTPPMGRDTIFRIASMTKPVAAAAAMMLVDDGALSLDDAIDPWIPELADRRVLRALDGPLDDTVPAHRPLTLRDLLTMRMGLGYILARSDDYPIQHAIKDLNILQGMPRLQEWPDVDTWIAGIGTLPLMAQPGERWMYDLSLEVLGVLVSRVSGLSLGDLLQERLFAPLKMKDTGFFVPPEKQSRLATAYESGPAGEGLRVYDTPEDGGWSRMPPFHSAAAGLAATADDYRAFLQLLLDRGVAAGTRLLSEKSVDLMTRDHLTEAQRNANRIFLGAHSGWGFGLAVNREVGPTGERPGRYGWTGGIGTTAYADPNSRRIGILLTQRLLDSPRPPEVFDDFWAHFHDI